MFRWFAEVEGVPFRTAVLMGTPNRGSDLTKLRTLLEAKQFLGDLKLGYSEALELVILDSNGLISFALQPESLFLRYLNRERKASRATRTRYAIIRGRALKPRYALLAGTSAAAGRVALRRTLKKRDADSLMRAEAGKWIERLRVPREVSHGDLAVTLESATLTGAGRMTTFRTDHVTMLRHSDVLKSVAEWLEQEDATHE